MDDYVVDNGLSCKYNEAKKYHEKLVALRKVFGMLNELTPEQKELFEVCVEHNVIVQMPPKKRYTMEAKIISVKKGTPRIVEP